MRKSAFLLASPWVLGMLWAGVPVCLGDDTTTAPNGSGDWFRQPGTAASTSAPSGYTPAPAPTPAPPPIFSNNGDNRIFSPYSESGDYPSRDLHDWVFANAHAAT